MRQYEENHPLSARWAWLLIVLLCLALIGWGLVNYGLVRNAPRRWDYGALPEPPASSIYTTSEPSASAKPQRQIEPLPGSRPLTHEEASP